MKSIEVLKHKPFDVKTLNANDVKSFVYDWFANIRPWRSKSNSQHVNEEKADYYLLFKQGAKKQ